MVCFIYTRTTSFTENYLGCGSSASRLFEDRSRPDHVSQDSILLLPEGHIRLLGFEGTGFEYTESGEKPPSRYHLAFLAPEILKEHAHDKIESVSLATDVYAFACVCVEASIPRPHESRACTHPCRLQLFNEGRRPFDDAMQESIKRSVKIGGRPSQPDMIPDEIWDVVVHCWDQCPAKRPDARSLVDELSVASQRPRDFLSLVLDNLTPTAPDRDRIVKDLAQLARTRNLSKATDLRGSDAQCAMDILEQVTNLPPFFAEPTDQSPL